MCLMIFRYPRSTYVLVILFESSNVNGVLGVSRLILKCLDLLIDIYLSRLISVKVEVKVCTLHMLFGSLTSWNCKHIEFIYCVCKCTSCFSCTKAAAAFWWLGLMSRNASSCFLYHLLLNTITVQDFLVSIIVMKYVVHLNKIGFVNFQDARVWLPDPTLVWKCATLLEDFKGQKQLAIRYDDGSVSSVITVYQSLPI